MTVAEQVRCGAWQQADGRVRFRLWAPAAVRVELLLDAQCITMQALAGGFHEVSVSAATGARYWYRIDGNVEVADPASRWQPDGVTGASAVFIDEGFTWQHEPSPRPWHELVIYEVHVGCAGGYGGLQAQLPALAAMGITALELMPLAQCPGQRNWGYDGVFPYAPAEVHGSPDELKALIDHAHGLGMAVLLDVVYNHFGPQGNMLPQYAPAFVRADRPTPWGDAIDFRQQEVQQFFIDNALMWLEAYRFDGLRLDAVQEIVPNAFLGQLADSVRQRLSEHRQIHLVLENEHRQPHWLQDRYQGQWNNDFHHALHVMVTGETEGYYRRYAIPGQAEAAMVRCLLAGFSEPVEEDEGADAAPPLALKLIRLVAFCQNHDQIGNRALGERLCALTDPGRAALATALAMLTPMVPMVFMGEPWQCASPFLYFTDFDPVLGAAVREGRRQEFREFAGFGDAQARLGIPDPNALNTFARSAVSLPADDDAAARRAIAAFTQWVALRQRYLWPAMSSARALDAQVLGKGAFKAGWQLPTGQWWVAFNVGQQALRHDLPEGEVVLRIGFADDTDEAVVPAAGMRVHWVAA